MGTSSSPLGLGRQHCWWERLRGRKFKLCDLGHVTGPFWASRFLTRERLIMIIVFVRAVPAGFWKVPGKMPGATQSLAGTISHLLG